MIERSNDSYGKWVSVFDPSSLPLWTDATGWNVFHCTPIEVVVPELPPGAVQVSMNGVIAYQFNGIYYQPVFVNGITEYETFMA